MSLDVNEGAVVGVLGPWGSGKTSFVNLVRRHLENSGVKVFDFNPWMFSGADQLVDAFFVEVSAQLRIRGGLAEIGKLLGEYGEAFSGIGGVATKALARFIQRRNGGIDTRCSRIRKALASLDRPFVVVLDDIDRLTAQEIRDVFKLVRLVANFPNVVYLLAFDRLRVEQALEEQGIPGRDYLEKILQVGVDLPAVPTAVLDSQILKSMNSAIQNVEDPGRLDENSWPDIFAEIIRPLIRNIRDVRRYTAAIYGTVRDLRGQVALVDVLALEAIRVFLPDVFSKMHEAVGSLTGTSDGYERDGDHPDLKKQIDDLVAVAGERGDIVRSLVVRLFPAGGRHVGGSHHGNEWSSLWLRERRVAHEEVLRLYLERLIGERLQAFADAEKAWALMTNRDALDDYLRSLDPERIEDVISSLEAYENEFRHEQVVPTAVVLLNLLPKLPERPRRMLDFDTRLVVKRVVYRLVRALEDHQAVESAVCEIQTQTPSLSSQLELLTIVGYREGAGHRLVSSDSAKRLEREWRDKVRSASAETLARERDLLRVLCRTRNDADPGEPALVVPESSDVTHALLRSARSEVLSQTLGNRAVHRSPQLAWNSLVELCGDETALRQRIEALRVSRPDGAGDLLQLAERYLDGWRPVHSD